MPHRTYVTIAAVTGAAVVALAMQAYAGGDKIAFPQDYAKGVLYTTVDRPDNKQYRELYGPAAALDAAKKGEPLPSGTVLTLVQYAAKLDAQGNPEKDANGRFIKTNIIAYTVMEKRAGWGTEYPDNVRNGEWEYQAFTADRNVSDKVDLRTCFQCHKPHADQDFVISLASLKGVAAGQMAAPPPGPDVVSIAGFHFGPEQVTVATGAPITWVNTDASPHQVVLTGRPQKTPILLKSQSASLTIAEPGTYDYICGLHPSIKGKIVVK